MTQVFISYTDHSSGDIEFADKLASDLRSKGIKVWKAPGSLLPGERWLKGIERGILTSTHLVLILSPEAVASDGVNFEMDMAIPLEWEGKINIVPVEYIECELPRRWRIYQAIKRFPAEYDYNLQRLLSHIEPVSNPIQDHSQPISDEELDALLIQGIRALLASLNLKTQRNYSHHLKEFMDWHYTQERIGLADQLRKYIAYLEAQKMAPNTIRNRLNIIKRMIKTAAKLDLDQRLAYDALLADDVVLSEVHDVKPKVELSNTQIQTLLEFPQISTLAGIRDKCILELMIIAGLRRAEIANLTWGNMTHNGQSHELIGLVSGRSVVISESLANLIGEWGQRADLDPSDSRSPIFCWVTKEDRAVNRQRGISGHAIYSMVKKYTRQSGLPRIHPDALRQLSSSFGYG